MLVHLPSGRAGVSLRLVEIQFHPGDVRRKVLRFQLDGTRLTIALYIAAALVGLQVFGLAVAPVVALRARDEQLGGRARIEHQEIRKTLDQRIARLEALQKRAEDSRLLLSKLSGMYGLPAASRGLGGFPLPVANGIEPGSPEQVDLLVRQAEQGIVVASKFLEELVAYEERHREIVRFTPSVSPLPPDTFVLTSAFGPRTSPFTRNQEFHNGLDFSVAEGTVVTAPADGTVAFAGRFPLSTSVNWSRYGNCVVLAHDGYFQTIYAHLAETTVRTGQKVGQGQSIGKVGSTGWSTSPHLHYEIRVKSTETRAGFLPVDPRIYILNCRWDDDARLIASRGLRPSADDFDPLPIRGR